MEILTESQLQYKNFVPAQRDIRLRVKLTVAQGNEVAKLLLAAYPALDEMRKAGQLQFINSAGQLRVAGVRGGVLPTDLTIADVELLANTVKDEMPADDGRGSHRWADPQAMAFGRRGGR